MHTDASRSIVHLLSATALVMIVRCISKGPLVAAPGQAKASRQGNFESFEGWIR
jgi:hypothetical protein